MMPEVEPKVIIRMGTHAEKDYLQKTLRFFDGIAVGANLVEATPGATASLLVRFGGKKQSLPFYIDPMTYAFGSYKDESGKLRSDLDWIKSDQKRKGKIVRDFKRSYRGLAERLGGPFDEAINRKSALDWDDFSDPTKLSDSCRRIAEYQLYRIRDELAADPESKQFADRVPKPTAVFAPYFYIEPSHRDEWLDLDLRLAKATAELNIDVPVHAIICADASFLGDSTFLDRLAADLPKTGVDAVWLWFSAFREDAAPVERLKAFRSLVETLSPSMEVFNRHGGYFSLALCKRGLSGVSHGVGYGEQKNVLPIIGRSMPTVRYYLPAAHKRFGVPQIERCFDASEIESAEEFHEKVCDCVICKGVLSGDVRKFSQFGEMHRSRPEAKRLAQTPAAAKRCRFHFLLMRIRERDWLKTASNSDILADLNTAADVWGKHPTLTRDVGHLALWQEALK